MMSVVNNLSAMNAQRQYNLVTSDYSKSAEKLSSGYRINRAADDAAGLTISEKMRSKIRALNQGSDNIQDGISVMQIADGALSEVNDMLHRMTELSVKSANGTNTSADRGAIQKEINQIVQEIDRIAESTEFNTMKLFNGTESDSKYNSGSLTKLVTTNSVGGLSESYKAENGNYFPAAYLDFSGVNSDNVDKLYGKGFSFICGWGCGEVFQFEFKNGDGSQDTRENISPIGSKYTIDIHGLTSGSAIVNKIYSAVSATKGTTYPNCPISGGLSIAHRQAIKTEGNKLVVISTEGAGTSSTLGTFGFATAEAAAAKYKNATKGGAGSFDASELTGDVEVVNDIKKFNIQCSNDIDDYETIKTHRMNSEVLGVDKVDASTQAGAKSALSTIENASAIISEHRSEYGAYQNRLEHSYANNENKAENLTAAESAIRDTDMASEMVRLASLNILSQAGTSMMAQANQSTQNVLSLLQ